MRHLSLFKMFLMSHMVSMTFLISDAIFHWSGYSYYMTFADFLPNLSMMILIFTALAVCITVIIKGIEVLLKSIIKRLGISIDFKIAYTWLFLLILSVVTVKFFKLWMDSFISVPYWNILRFVIAVLILFFVSVLAWRMKEKLTTTVVEKFKPIFRLFLIISAGAVLVVVYHSFQSRLQDVPLPVQTVMAIPSRPNIILVTMDALSAKDMSVYGYERNTTPFLEEFMKESHIFTRFYANSNFTTPSLVSMLISKYPWSHQTYHHNDTIHEDMCSYNLARVLKENGYTTMAFVANRTANPFQLNIARDFDIIVPDYKLWAPHKTATLLGLIFSRILDHRYEISWWWLNFYINELFFGEDNSRSEFPAHIAFNSFFDRMPLVRKPFFAWIHVLPPHTPYLPPEPYKNTFASKAEMSSEIAQGRYRGPYSPSKQREIDSLRKRYDEFILYVDAELQDFVTRLKRAGFYDKSLLIFSSDHGEIFEKGFFAHGGPYLYEPLIHIPMIIHEPGQRKGTRLDTLAGLIDLSPTLLNYLGLPIPEWMDGESFLPALQNGTSSSRPKFTMWFEKNRSLNHKITTGTVAVLENDYKLIYYIKDGRSELYNLRLDPREEYNLIEVETQIAQQLKSIILEKLRHINATRK